MSSTNSTSGNSGNSSGSSPLLSLCMKSSRSPPPSERFQVHEEDEMGDRIRVMMAQEVSSTYTCRDYILRRKMEQEETSTTPIMNEIDTLCREKMCEWAYRVVDHFHASREIVAIAFSYLDRFVDRCSCDRAAFKLCAMTSVYMATKVFNSREISMASLADLSRGEFDMAHISEMEGIILQTLDWRMHPPTSQDFINYLHMLVPLPTGPVTRAIYARATFFAELSLFDYCFVTQSKSAIGIAALMNAMEGMEGTVSEREQAQFTNAIAKLVDLEHSSELIDSIRNRLWYVYSQSAQYHDDEILPSPQKIPRETSFTHSAVKGHLGGDSSPVSVSFPVSSR